METKNMIIQVPLLAVAVFILLSFLGFLPGLHQGWMEAVINLCGIALILTICFWLYQALPKVGIPLMLPVFLLSVWLLKTAGRFIFSTKEPAHQEEKASIIQDVVASDRHVEFRFLNESGISGRMFAILQPCSRLEPTYSNRIDLGHVRAAGWNHLYFSFRDIRWDYLKKGKCIEIPLYFIPEGGASIMVGSISYEKGVQGLAGE